ncbi:MAG: single-stranded-DNA-specific exonuclease RecJ [Sporomusaceae bacterium]|nr:single-stranded-DNA-specific exonuclease RecJ [Sporomusaceae bacterium]
MGQLLLNRGLDDAAAAQQFLAGTLQQLQDPFLLKGMAAAVDRTAAAIAAGEKIVVYGDYDVDGITATALVYNCLRELGATIEYYIPERQSEGYGLHSEALQAIAAAGAGLVITVDCGISAWQEVESAGRLDIIVTDHHQPPERLPAATAVINPKQPGCPYPEKELAGVGVAFKFCQALASRLEQRRLDCFRYLDLVAIGTVADMVPLTGENRLLVKFGIDRLRHTENAGLAALISVCELQSASIDAGKIGFVIAPRLNAAGRLNHAAAGVELLTSPASEPVRELAQTLDLTNRERQEVERDILEKAEAALAATDWQNAKALVIAGEDWHPGVIGIVASRLVERYYRPTILISVRDGIGKGSCRSIPGFDMYEGLSRCAEWLLQFGGHRQAAGLSLKAADIDLFRQKFNETVSQELTEADFLPVLNIDAMVSLNELNASLIEQLACLEPFGMGNPSPLLACSPVKLQSAAAFGKDKRHLRLWVCEREASSEAIAWNKGELADCFERDCAAEIAFVPEVHEWQGRRSVRMRAIDVRKADRSCPDKQAIGKLYLLLKGLSENGMKTVTADWRELSRQLEAGYRTAMAEAAIVFSLSVLAELDLLVLQSQNAVFQITLQPQPAQKLDILASATFRAGHIK